MGIAMPGWKREEVRVEGADEEPVGEDVELRADARLLPERAGDRAVRDVEHPVDDEPGLVPALARRRARR